MAIGQHGRYKGPIEIFGVLLFVIGLGCAYWAYNIYHESKMIETTATIERSYIEKPKMSVRSILYVDYAYSIDGTDYHCKIPVRESNEHRLQREIADYQPGKTLTVFCDPKHPDKMEFEHTNDGSMFPIVAGGSAVIILLSFALLANLAKI